MHTTPFYSIIDNVSQKELSSLRLLNVFVINIFIVMQYDLLVNTCTFKFEILSRAERRAEGLL